MTSSKASHSQIIAGVDIGGTKILTLITDDDGRELGRDRRLTHAQEGTSAVIGRIEQSIRAALAAAGLTTESLAGIGLAAAGACDTNRGIVTVSPNLPGWRDVPLARLVSERFGVPAFLENDATAAALAEHRFGAGQGSHHMVYLTVSTGVGGGIIANGRLYRGANGAAGEIGHMIIDAGGPPCSCGKNGCLEALINGKALVERAQRLMAEGGPTLLSDVDELSGETINEAAMAGDPVALKAVTETGHWLGVGLVNIVNILNPEVIVIGGGLSNLGDLLIEPAREVMTAWAFPLAVSAVRIEIVQLGEQSGALGAVAVAKERLEA